MPNEARRTVILLCAALVALAGAVNVAGAQERSPAPAATPPACARPNAPAIIVRAVDPDEPPMAQQQGIIGVVQVIVSLDAESHVVRTRIMSSPSAILNQAALAAARQSTFRTEIRDCRPVAGELLYAVDFGPKATFTNDSVTVFGSGYVRRAPDVAQVEAMFTQSDVPGVDSNRKLDADVATLKSKLATLGIRENDVHVLLPVTTRPVPVPPRTVPPGTRYASISVRPLRITVGSIANAARVAAVVASFPSANSVTIRYSISDVSSAYREALSIALKDAEARARNAASAQHVRLGALKGFRASPTDAELLRVPPSAYMQFDPIPTAGGFVQPDRSIPDVGLAIEAQATYAVSR
jgi:uncharacterized protein YggE